MPNRMTDWLRQAHHDLAVARTTCDAGQYDWACFASQQAAEKALKGLYQHFHAEGWGHVLDRLVEGLLPDAPELARYRDVAKVLDKFYIPTRYPNGLEAGRRRTSIRRRRRSRRSLMLRTSLNSVRHDAVPRNDVITAAREWAERLQASYPEVVRVGYFGSYARDEQVPGSDVDVLIEITKLPAATEKSPPRALERIRPYRPPDSFPVGMDIFVYTSDELASLRAVGMDRDLRWLVPSTSHGRFLKRWLPFWIVLAITGGIVLYFLAVSRSW